MELNEKQKQGLQIAVDRYNSGEKCTIISGYAGTGKSTLVKFIISALNVEDKDVVYTSFTGKATQVLAKKGNTNTRTLHKLLFISHPKPDGTYIRIPVTTIPYKIVVVDEVSMVPKSLMEKLSSYPNIYILCLGDPFQLPPINKNEDNHLLDHAHIFLDEVMRQAEGSEIVQLSMKIRNREPIGNYKGKQVQIFSRAELNTGMLQWADQILVATNDTRKKINAQMRDLLGHSGDPEDGDKIICYRNYWEDECQGGSALVNGTIGTIKNGYSSFEIIPGMLNKLHYGQPRRVETLNCDFVEESGEVYPNLIMDKNMILTGEKTLDWKTEYAVSQNKLYKHLLPYEFTYGYAITTHRAQGSEWDKVLVIEEKFPFNEEEHARWLYTAVTRASEKLVLIRAD